MQVTVQNQCLLVTFMGDILSTNVAVLRTGLLQKLAENPPVTAVVADLINAKTVDSQGLNLLIALSRECERRKLSFKITQPQPEVHRLLAYLNLTSRFGLPSPAAK